MTNATFKALTNVYGVLLKAGWGETMGQAHGSITIDDTVSESLHRECERLREENAKIKSQARSIVGELEAQAELRQSSIKRLTGENEQLKTQLAGFFERDWSIGAFADQARKAQRLQIEGTFDSRPVSLTLSLS